MVGLVLIACSHLNCPAPPFLQALGLKRDDTFSVTMLGHCIEMYIGDTEAYIGTMFCLHTVFFCKAVNKENFIMLVNLNV